MRMTEIISKELVQDRIDFYINENHSEILEMIDKKIETKVKEAIRDIFTYQNRWDKTPASKIIHEKVEAEVTLQAENAEIDKEWIQKQVEKKVRTAIKNIDVVLKE